METAGKMKKVGCTVGRKRQAFSEEVKAKFALEALNREINSIETFAQFSKLRFS